MPNTLDLEPFILIPASSSIALALAMIRATNVSFAIIEAENYLQAVVQEYHLAQLANLGNHSVESALEHLPALFLVDDGKSGLEAKDIEQFADILGQTGAPGLVLDHADQVLGILSARTIFDALPPSALPIDTSKRIYGNIAVPVRTFICRKCLPPQPRRRPRDGSTPPTCPRDRSHGLMEKEEL